MKGQGSRGRGEQWQIVFSVSQYKKSPEIQSGAIEVPRNQWKKSKMDTYSLPNLLLNSFQILGQPYKRACPEAGAQGKDRCRWSRFQRLSFPWGYLGLNLIYLSVYGLKTTISQMPYKQKNFMSRSSGGWNIKDQDIGRVSVYWGPSFWFSQGHFPAVAHRKAFIIFGKNMKDRIFLYITVGRVK